MDDGTKADGEELAVQAARPTGCDLVDRGEGAAETSFAQVVRGTPVPDGAVVNKGEDEPQAEADDDEQVERFYALLANIRAMRSVYTPGGGETANGGSAARKRLRGAGPPWRLAFRLEDFEDEAATATSRCAMKKERRQPAGEEEDGPGEDDETAATATAFHSLPRAS